MFWRFGTGKKLPGQKIALRLVAAAVAVALMAPFALARPYEKQRVAAVRVRLSGLFLGINYNSFSEASNGLTQFSAYPALAGRAEAESWFTGYHRRWPLIGAHAEIESFSVRLFGRPISYRSGFASLAWRPLGNIGRKWIYRSGMTWNAPELVLMGGASWQSFPDVRGYARSTSFDVLNPQLIGFRLDGRWRGPLDRRNKWRIDTGAHWIGPLKMRDSGGSSDVGNANTRSYGVDLFIERRLHATDRVDLGFGFMYENNQLEYRPVADEKPQDVHWNNYGPLLFIQYWF